MSEISIYDVVPTPKLADKLIGTSVGGVIPDVTYNFTLEELLQLFIPNIPANTLQGVLDYGNTATQNINLTGTINTTDLNVFATANILDSVLSGETHITGELYDGLDSKGTAGQVLRSTGSGVEWYTVPTVIPTLQQVLTSGNTADKNIILTANITSVTATATNVVSNSSLSVNGSLKDGTASAGGSNQILSSTGSGVKWVDLPVYNVVSPLLYNSTTKTFSIQVANASQSGYLSNADWINFDGKQDAIILTTSGTSGPSTFVGNTLNIPVYTPDLSGYVPVSRTLTINGVTYDLSANRSWTIDAGVAEVTATAPLHSSGGAYPDISISKSNSSTDGYLSSADWLTFNSKQDALGGTGLVKSTAGTITYITDNSSNWNTAYNDSIVSAAVTGTSTKTLTLTQQDAGTITASWTDNGLTSVGVSMPSAFSVANSPLTSNGTIAITGAGTSLQYIDGTGALQTFPTIANEAATLVTEVYNETGATLTKGTVVYINGGHGNLPTVAKALATSDATSAQTYGVVQVDITNMNSGHVVVIGSLSDLDTRLYSNGTQLYLSSTTAGAWTDVKQYAPAHLVYVGVVVRSHPTQGVVEIKIQNGYELDELHNVSAQTPSNGSILQYVASTQLWTSVAGTTTNIAEGTNLYYLDSRARAALSFAAGSGAYNSTTGVITIPTNTNQLTNGASFITLGSLSAAAPLSYNSSIGAFSISQAGASTNGYLSSTDWNTFNNKQVAGNYITSLTGEATGTGPGATAVTLSNSAVTGKVLTGVNITGGTVVATDTMLTAFGKLQNQINALVGSTIYQGVWNASTNTPTLTSSVGTKGYYYIVNVAGNTNLNGITDWQVGDWAIYDGTAWQKVDNTDAVTSVNGFTGAVSLTTDNIAQGTTNFYFSNALARGAVSLTTTGSSGAATYNNTTGVFNIPNYGTALANYLPLTGGTLTGGLVINPANTAIIGLDVASNTVTLRSDSTNPFARQLTTTMNSGTLVKVQAAGYGGTYVTDLGFYTSSSSAINTTPNLYLTGGNNRVGINTTTPAYTLDVVGTAGVSGQLTLGSTITNGTYTYTLPSATGTLALVGGTGVGTVTSVAALTIGTTGTDLSSTVANSTTTPVITLNVPTASGTNRGALSAADWTTFNNKQAALNGTGFVKISGTTISYDNTNYLPTTLSPTANTVLINGQQFSIYGSTAGVYNSGRIIVDDLFGAVGYQISGVFKGLRIETSGNAYFDNTGTTRFYNSVRFDSTLTNGTYTYTLPSATGTLALTSQIPSLTGYVPYTGATQAVNLGAYDLTVNGIKVGRGAGSISDNTVVGSIALGANTTGSGNTAIGYAASNANTTAGNNTSMGYFALASTTTGGNNTAIGSGALTTNSTGIFNTGVGKDVLSSNTTGQNNVAVGPQALYSNSTASNNTAFGYQALFYNTGANNTAVGKGAGINLTTGSNNTIIGGYFGVAAMANNVVLSDGGGNIRFQYDGTNTLLGQNGNVLINTSTDAGYKLDVNGEGRIQNTLTIKTPTNATAIALLGRSADNFSALRFLSNNAATTYATIYSNASDLIIENNGIAALTINSSRAATFSSSVTAGGDITSSGVLRSNSSNTFLASQPTAANAAQYQSWLNSAGTRRGYFGYAAGGDNTITLNNESGGNIILQGGNVGIGTTSPSALLHTYTSTGSVRTLTETGNSSSSAFTAKNSTQATDYGTDSIGGFIQTQGAYPLLIYTNSTERIRITSSGNVGIGTTSPSNILQIASSSNTTPSVYSSSITNYSAWQLNDSTNANRGGIAFLNSSFNGGGVYQNNGVYVYGNLSGGLTLSAEGANNLYFATNSSERMRITSGGNVLIGTTSDNGFKLQVSGQMSSSAGIYSYGGVLNSVGTASNSIGSGPYLSIVNSSNSYQILQQLNASYNLDFWSYRGGWSNVSRIDGSTGIYMALSDKTKKKDFEESNIGLAEVMQLKPMLFRMKSDDANSSKQLGFLAQDVKNIIPQSYVEQDNFIGLQDRPIIAALTKAVQEQQVQIQELKEQLANK